MKIQYLYTGVLVILFSCNNPVKPDSKKLDTFNTKNQDSFSSVTQEKDTIPEDKQRIHANCPYTKIKASTKLEVIKAEKEIEYTSRWYSEYGDKCGEWNLNTADIEFILRQSEEIEADEWHYNFDILPCYYRGEVSINGKQVLFQVNSGASATLVFKDSSVFIGYKKADYIRYFIKGRYELE
jgi:hypothetical protein